jgi:Zn-dependent protease
VLTIHEVAHGWVAFLLGDHTARDNGRLTLNPFSHLDLIGTIMLFYGPLGWAKPVPVNPYNLHNPKRDIIFVSLAGPLSNILAAFIYGYIIRFFGEPLYAMSPQNMQFLTPLFLQINLGIAVFNLLPIIPLDGSKVLMSLLPQRALQRYINIMRYVPNIFLGLIIIEWLSDLAGHHVPLFSILFIPIFGPFYNIMIHLIFGKG